jgi:hypothetical protein
MTWKVKSLIEYLEKNYKDDDTLFAVIWDKQEVFNSFEIEATDDEWESIANGMGGDYSSDALYEEFSNAVSDTLTPFYCDECGYYKRDTTENDEGDDLCAICVEQIKERRGAEALAEAERTKALVKPDEDIIY